EVHHCSAARTARLVMTCSGSAETRGDRGDRMSSAVLSESTFTPQAAPAKQEGAFEFPGIPTTCDGSEAVVHVETAVCQAAGAYPITSSTNMGGGFNAAVMNGQKNL